jgi:hypothetical protein
VSSWVLDASALLALCRLMLRWPIGQDVYDR